MNYSLLPRYNLSFTNQILYFNEDGVVVNDVECFYKGSICANGQAISGYCFYTAKFIKHFLPMSIKT